MRRRRLQPKAAPAPSRGRGPGTVVPGGVGAPRITWIDSLVPSRVQVPIRPVVVKPRPARVLPLNVALLTIEVLEVYEESIEKRFDNPFKRVVKPVTLEAGPIKADPLKLLGPVIVKRGDKRPGPVQIVALEDRINPFPPQEVVPIDVAPVRSRLPLV